MSVVCGLLLLVASSALRADDCVSPRGLRLRGDVESRCETLSFDGRIRSYRVYVPAHVATPAPVVFGLHGGGGSGSGMELVTKAGFNRIADREGAIIVYPDGGGLRSRNNSRPAGTPAGAYFGGGGTVTTYTH